MHWRTRRKVQGVLTFQEFISNDPAAASGAVISIKAEPKVFAYANGNFQGAFDAWSEAMRAVEDAIQRLDQ